MPRKPRPTQTSLSVSLLKPGVSDALAFKSIQSLNRYPVSDGTAKIGDLYIAPSVPNEPRWGRYIKPYVGGLPKLENRTTSAVLIIKIQQHTFAITFGYGRNLLVSDAAEDRFGLVVTLNAVSENSIRTISRKSLDAFAHHTQTQAIRAGRLPQFGIDLERDLLQAVTGTPEDPTLGARLVGKDSLGIVTRTPLSKLPKLLEKYASEFKSNKYKSKYPEIDHITEEQNPAVIGELESKLVKKLKAQDFERLWLAPPTSISWDKVAGFSYQQSCNHIYDDLHVSDLLKHTRKVGSLTASRLRQKRAYAVLSDGSRPTEEWPVFNCIHFEAEHNGDSFVLSGGRWFRLNTDFANSVNSYIDRLIQQTHQLPSAKPKEAELAYNTRASKRLSGHILVDRDTIQHGGGHSKIEFCDIFNNAREMIHIKRYGGSGVLSHLFSQGAASAELLLTDSVFREKVRNKLPKSHQSLIPSKPIHPDKFSVVYGIIGRPAGTKSLSDLLPFFSRVSLRRAAKSLKLAGYNVSVAWIPTK